MRCSIIPAIALTSWLIVPTALAKDCNNVESQAAITQCTYESWQEADAELNSTWSEVKRSFGTDDWNKRRKAALLKSQRAWLKFRDADCEDAAGTEWEGGSGRSMVEFTCKEEMTRRRTEKLRGRYLAN